MSMQSWTECGYGFPLNSGDNIEAIKKFICNNSSIEGLPPEYQIPEDRGYDAGEEPEQEEMIGVDPRYIWDLNEKDRTLTKEQITEILEKYARMLGISAKPDFFNAEYYG